MYSLEEMKTKLGKYRNLDISFVENPYRIKKLWKIGYAEVMEKKYEVRHIKTYNILYTVPINNPQESLEMNYSKPFTHLEDKNREVFKKRCIGYSETCSEYLDITMEDMDELYERVEAVVQ